MMNETSPDTHYCPRCGAQLTDQVDTCPACGQALCPACGAQITEDATRCSSCGVVFELACPDCGAPLKPEDVRCSQCGATFKNELAQPAALVAAPVSTQAEHLQAAYLLALNRLQAKVPPEQVEDQLVATGLTAATSHALVDTLQTTRRQVERETGKRAMLIGGLWTVGGLAITLIGQSLANERGGSYLILWGAVLIGALQFLRGLLQFLGNAPVRSNGDGQSGVDPLMAANGFIWPMPKQNQSAWLGVIAFLGLMALLSFSNLGPPLINKSASQVNLTVADLGSGFTLTEESGADAFQDKDLRDASQRTLEDGNSFVQATVLVWKQRVGDSPSALLAAFDKRMRQDASVTASFEAPQTISVGKQSGALESFKFESNGRTAQGFLLAFTRDNVMVLVFEVGPSGAVTEQQILSHAQLINQHLE